MVQLKRLRLFIIFVCIHILNSCFAAEMYVPIPSRVIEDLLKSIGSQEGPSIYFCKTYLLGSRNRSLPLYHPAVPLTIEQRLNVTPSFHLLPFLPPYPKDPNKKTAELLIRNNITKRPLIPVSSYLIRYDHLSDQILSNDEMTKQQGYYYYHIYQYLIEATSTMLQTPPPKKK